MNTTSLYRNNNSGSAFIAVVILIAILLTLAGTILSYSLSERRLNERSRLLLRARNSAENLSVYAAEQLTTKLYRDRSVSQLAYIGGANQIYMPDSSGTRQVTPPFSNASDWEVYAGLTSAGTLTLITDATDPNKGLYVNQSIVKIISKATATEPNLGSVTAYTEQDMQLALIPLFQFAIFYNMDLEFGPGAAMSISGPVHTNGNLIARNQTSLSNNIGFTGNVTVSKGFYANTAYKGVTYSNTGGADAGPGGNGTLSFINASTNAATSIYDGSKWRDCLWGQSAETNTISPAGTRQLFMNWAGSSTGLGGNLQVYGPILTPPGVTPLPTNATQADMTAALLATRPITIGPALSTDTATTKQSKFARRTGLYIIVNPDANTRNGILPDESLVSMPGYSYRCWLNSVATDGTHTLTEVVLPGQPSYGNLNATRNNLPNRFTDKTAIISNQVLRIPNSGTLPYTNTYTYLASTLQVAETGTLTGCAKGAAAPALLSNATPGPLADAYFYDLRRADNSLGFPTSRSTGTPFAPRPIAKIDFDWTRFRLMVERTIESRTTSSANIYWPNEVKDWSATFPNLMKTPTANTSLVNQWNAFIFNPDANPVSVNLGVNFGTTSAKTFSDFPVNATTLNGSTPGFTIDPFKLYFASSGSAVSASDLAGSATSPWFDGITIYIHSVGAEILTSTAGARDRIDSGVRLWNGRGPLVSLNGSTYANCTGSNFCTNDAVYIVGHYNANGTINTDPSATGNGGYSATCPDSSAEMLTVVQGDAITVLSQPTFTYNSGSPYQNGGWSDAFSGHICDNGTWNASWATSAPSGSNDRDGINANVSPANMPNVNSSTPANAGAGNNKFKPSATEISACLLTGIVETGTQTCGSLYPSNTGVQSSGGVHNFPRLLEAWSGFGGTAVGLYIRGSMVAMFRSGVAVEPWSLRVYDAPGRYWGFNTQLASASHDVPLEPIMASTSRLRYHSLPADAPTGTDSYSSLKTNIIALPH